MQIQTSPLKTGQLSDLTNAETEREITIKAFKQISIRLLHERNIYVFLASVGE